MEAWAWVGMGFPRESMGLSYSSSVSSSSVGSSGANEVRLLSLFSNVWVGDSGTIPRCS